MSKSSRPLILILTIILSFSFLSVNSFAASDDNLIDSNMSNWVDFGKDEPTLFQKASVIYLDNDTNYITVSGSKNSVVLFDLTEFLKIGESYQFSFFLPKTEGLNNTSLNSCKLSWFLCDGSGDVYPTIGSNVFEITIDNSNKDKFLGNTTTFEFTYTQGFKNTYLCFGISPGDNVESYNYLQLYIANVKLERLASESEKKLDGILGWLQELWNSITNGFSDLTSDFSGYINSLGDRISDYFSNLGENISNSFTNLSVNISGFFTDLLDGIKEFFRGFGNLILYFNWEGDYTNPFEGRSIFGVSNSGDSSNSSSLENLLDISLFSFKSSPNVGVNVEVNSDDSVYIKLNGSSSYKSFTTGFFGSFLKDRTYRLSFKISNFTLLNSSATSNNKLSITVRSSSGIQTSYTISYNANDVYFIDLNFPYDYSIYLDFKVGKTELLLSDFTLYDITDLNIGDETVTGSVDVQSSLDTVLEYFTTVTTDVENVMDSITGTIELFDEFCEEFPFIKALCIFTLFILVACVVVGL